MMLQSNCPFCGETCGFERQKESGKIVNYFECNNCGDYTTQEFSPGFLEQYNDKKYIIAGYLFEMKELGRHIEFITENNFTALFDNPIVPKNTAERLDKLLLHIYRNTHEFGQTEEFNEGWKPQCGYAKSMNELKFMMETLLHKNFIEHPYNNQQKYGQFGTFQFRLTANGISCGENSIKQKLVNSSVFVAMAFTEEMNFILDTAIKPAATECGFQAYIVSDEEYNEDINDRIIADIKESRFVVADFTEQRGGVYFEAGYAQGLGIPIIRTCKKSECSNLHFDVNHYNFILWEKAEDLKTSLCDRIRATIL